MKFLKTKLLGFFLTLALVFSAILPYNALTVKADTIIGGINIPVEGTLYYYGDCSTRQAFLQSVIQTVNYNYCSSVYDIPAAIDEDIDEISDSFIIVEFVYDLKYELPLSGGKQRNADLLDGLLPIFHELKRNNNEIMFICDTAEELFAEHRHFLDLVDIHVNKDIMTPLMHQILYDASVATCNDGGKLANCTFLIDQSLVVSNSVFTWDPIGGEVLGFYFPRYFGEVYNANPFTTELFEKLESFNVNIFYQTSDTYFESILSSGFSLTNPENFSNYIQMDYVRTIGSSLNGASPTHAWLDNVNTLKDYFGINYEDIPDYVYNEGACSLADYTENTIYSIGSLLASFESTLSTIIRDFVNQADLTVYDNWESWSYITYKPITTSDNSWFKNIFFERGEYIQNWQVAYVEE